MKKTKIETKVFYLCGVDWDHEIGHTTVFLWRELKHLKRERTCIKQCGIVKIECRASWVRKQSYAR